MSDVEAIGQFNNITEPGLYHHEYWSYLPGHSVLMAARDEEKVIGVQALIAYYMNINGCKILTGKSERTLVSSKYRGGDIWANLMEICIEKGTNRGHEFFWGSNTSAVKAFKKVGFIHISGHRQRLLSAVSLSRVIKLMFSSNRPVPLSPIKAYRTLRSRNLEQGLEYMRLIASIYSTLFNAAHFHFQCFDSKDRFELENCPRSYDDIHNLYQEIRGDKCDLLWLHQDEAFCDWAFRLGGNPVKRWFAYENGKLRAYLYGIFDNSLARILDFAAADADAFKCLLGCFHQTCIEEGQIFMEVTVNPLCPQQIIPIKCLKGNGFLAAYTGGNTVVKPGRYKDIKILGNPQCLYITDLWSLLYNKRKVTSEIDKES